MTTTDNALNNNEVRQAIAEIDHADGQLSASMVDGAVVTQELSPTATRAVSDSQIEMYRKRAQLQRVRGRANLAFRHEGIASILANVTISERTIASAFERMFAGMENGIYVLSKRGEQVLGESQAEKLNTMMNNIIEKLEESARIDLAGVNLKLEQAKSESDLYGTELLTPTYAKPAAQHEVQLRTKTAKRVLDVFKKQDEAMVGLVKLSWNDAVDDSHVELHAEQVKKNLRELSIFLGKTVKGMKNRVMPDVDAAPAAANDTAGVDAPQAEEQAA